MIRSLGTVCSKNVKFCIIRIRVKSVSTQNKRCSHSLIPKPRIWWKIPDQLSTQELQKECTLRNLSTIGTRSDLVQKLRKDIKEHYGGYCDNALTLDPQFATNLQSDSLSTDEYVYSSIFLYLDDRSIKRITNTFDDPSMQVQIENICGIRLEGNYDDICELRNKMVECLMIDSSQSKETVYSLPKQIAYDLLSNNKVLLNDIRNEYDCNLTMIKHRHNNQDMMTLSVEGELIRRQNACLEIENYLNDFKSQYLSCNQILTIEQFEKINRKNQENQENEQNGKDVIRQNVDIEHSRMKNFKSFDGIVLHLDPIIKDIMSTEYLNQIGDINNCKIHLGNGDLFWLNDFEMAIEKGSNDDSIGTVRLEMDEYINNGKYIYELYKGHKEKYEPQPNSC